MANMRSNRRGQFTIIAALLVAVVLVGTLVTTYSAIQSSASGDQPQVLSSVDETNLALKQLLGFTVGYYGSILQVTGNTSYAKNLASIYLNSGLENIADSKPELGLSFRVSNLNLAVNWFMTSSYSSGQLNVTYDITSLGMYGLPYFMQCRLDVNVFPSVTGGPAIVSVLQDGATPLNTLTRQNFKFYRYQSNLTNWDLIGLDSDPQVFSNGTYVISIPSGYGIDSKAYLMQITDTRGVNVIGSSFNGYSSSFIWSSSVYSAGQQFITKMSDVDGSADKGSHNVFVSQGAKDGIYDVLTEQNTGANTEQFVTQISNVDGSADKGSHSNFNNQQSKDNNFDALTEQNTGNQQNTFGSNSGSSYTVVLANQLYGSKFTSPADAAGATLQNIIWYGRIDSLFGSGNAKAILVNSATKNIIATSSAISVSTTTQERTCTFTSPPTIQANTQYILMMVFSVSTRFYYGVGTANQGYLDSTNSYASPSNPTDATNNNNQYYIRATYQTPSNYVLDLEEQFTSVDFSQSNERLCVYAGAVGSESLKVDVYSGGSWVNLIPTLQAWNANDWTNVSVSSYLTSSTFTIRFTGSVETGDTVQNSWQVDAVLLHTWTDNYQLDLEEQFTGVVLSQSTEWLCIYAGSVGSESLKVDVYSGGSWVNLIPALAANQWNNVSVLNYLTSATFTIRFRGTVESADAVQDTYQIDATLLSFSSTVDPSSIQDSITPVEWLQNGTLRMLGQGLVSTSNAFPIPPLPIKAIHLNQTFINGTNGEIPFQIESWGSKYNIPLGLTNNATVFSRNEMVVFLLDTKVTTVTMWWNGSDMATQTPRAYIARTV